MRQNTLGILSFLILLLFITNTVFGQAIPSELKTRYEQSKLISASKVKSNPAISTDTLSTDVLEEVGKRINLALKNSYGANLDLIADQITSTNTQRDFWALAREPRESIINGSSFVSSLFESFVEAQIEANNVYLLLADSNKVFVSNDTDITTSSMASILLMRGISKAYLGLIYDQGVIVDSLGFLEEFEIDSLDKDLISYQMLIESGLEDIEASIDMVNDIEESEFKWEILPTPSEITKARFLKIAHSFAAKILISAPRSSDEFIDYNAVLEYAQKGLDAEYPNIVFNNIGSSGEMADYYSDWSNFVISCSNSFVTSCSGYLPTDVKILHLFDSTYATIYPSEFASNLDYREAVTDDPRLSYFIYTQNKGFLNASRDSTLLSNYFSLRGYAKSNWWEESYPNIYMTYAELQYIIAEAEAKLDNFSEANLALQNSPYGIIATDFEIDLPSVQLGYAEENGLAFNGPELPNDYTSFTNALHKEYSVEIGTFTTIGTHWFFMRRHDLLQEFTATQLPVPESILEAKGLENYSFGGLENSGKPGTAMGNNAWKATDELPKPFGLRANIRNREVELVWDEYLAEISGFRLRNESLEYDEMFPQEVTSVIIDNLVNGTTYVFELTALRDLQESEPINIEVTPTIFGDASFTFDPQETFVDQINIQTVTLKNFLDEPLVIDSIKMVSNYENPENPDHELYKYFYQEWRKFFSLSHSDGVIQAGDSIDFTITFEPELWGVHPLTHLEFYTSEGVFKLLHSPYNVGDGIEGGYVIAYIEETEGISFINTYYGLPDSVNFGNIEIGKQDSTMLTFKNKSTGTFFITSFYSRRLIIENDIVVEVTDGFPEFYFTIFEDTMKISTGDSLNFWIYAEPQEEGLYYANPSVQGTENSSTISTLQSFAMGPLIMTGIKGEPVSNKEEGKGILTYQLFKNYPNPFNPSTNIEFTIPNSSNVTITVFNILGQNVATLIDEKMNAGKHAVTFNASGLSSGMYFYRIEAGNFVQAQKMLLVK